MQSTSEMVSVDEPKRKRKPNVVKKLKSIFDKIQPEHNKILVIQPGSHFIRIGLADQLVCQTYHHCIAHPSEKDKPIEFYYPEEEIEYSRQEVLQYVKKHKVRPIPNGKVNASNFNSSSQQIELEDYNDAFLIDFIEPTKGTQNLDANGNTDPMDVDQPEYYVGEKARRIASLHHTYPGSNTFKLFYPILYGLPNIRDYSSIEAIKNDLYKIWTFHALKLVDNFKDYFVMLVVDDLLDRKTLGIYASVLMDMMECAGIQLLHTSACCGLATGWSTTCVVDIGAQKTSIACVENGLSLPYSRIYLPVGGDDITLYLSYLLTGINFPKLSIDSKPWQYDVIEDIKKNFVSLEPQELKLQQCEMYLRDYQCKTVKMEFKMFDQQIIAPFVLLYLYSCYLMTIYLILMRSSMISRKIFVSLWMIQTWASQWNELNICGIESSLTRVKMKKLEEKSNIEVGVEHPI
eukprot:NODE_245_length_11874_cov_0.539546.p3 type:complete len:461 gc:universal NODE_245_length_11874_cov_0.539546:8989-10371(+)